MMTFLKIISIVLVLCVLAYFLYFFIYLVRFLFMGNRNIRSLLSRFIILAVTATVCFLSYEFSLKYARHNLMSRINNLEQDTFVRIGDKTCISTGGSEIIEEIKKMRNIPGMTQLNFEEKIPFIVTSRKEEMFFLIAKSISPAIDGFFVFYPDSIGGKGTPIGIISSDIMEKCER